MISRQSASYVSKPDAVDLTSHVRNDIEDHLKIPCSFFINKNEKVKDSTVYILSVYIVCIVLDSNINSIMRVLDSFLAKVGVDKILHHVVGALICALFTFVFILQDAMFNWTAVAVPTIGAAVVFFVSIVKEYAFDDKVDWMDIVWAMAGCLWIYAAVAVGVWFNQLSA